MVTFKDGWNFVADNLSSAYAAEESDKYINSIKDEIEKTIDNLNYFNGYNTPADKLKGDVAEFWHAGTHNINAALDESTVRATVNRSHDFASPDITVSDGNNYGLKYYADAEKSAKSQAKSLFERYKEYQSLDGKDNFEQFLSDRGYKDIESVMNDPMYSGQFRVIPKDQLDNAVDWLKKKIAKESANRPEQVKRYQDTLDMLTDRLKSDDGTESIPLSKKEAEQLAQCAKEGNINPEDWGLTTENFVTFEYVLKQALKAGTTSAVISAVLKTAPEIYKAISYLVQTGEIDEEQLKKIGFTALSSGAEGFIRGALSSALTTCCTSGMLGSTLKSIDPLLMKL